MTLSQKQQNNPSPGVSSFTQNTCSILSSSQEILAKFQNDFSISACTPCVPKEACPFFPGGCPQEPILFSSAAPSHLAKETLVELPDQEEAWPSFPHPGGRYAEGAMMRASLMTEAAQSLL
jgi:hypothetical protein